MARDYMTIGEVVKRLGGAFPDLSISKVRFLEDEGLVSPERTPGGYRKFTQADIERVEVILKLQKEHFLPLSVIREKLVDYDRGKVPAEMRPTVAESAAATTLPLDDAGSIKVEEVPSSLGLPKSFIEELEEYGLLSFTDGPEGPEIEPLDIQIAHTAWDLRRFGVEPRHLRMYETYAEREATFFSQILMPSFRHRTPETRQKLVDTLGELTTLTADLKSHLLRRTLGRTFEDLT